MTQKEALIHLLHLKPDDRRGSMCIVWFSSRKPMRFALCLFCFVSCCVLNPLCFGDVASAEHGSIGEAHAERLSPNQGELPPHKHCHEGRKSYFTLAGRQIRFDNSRDFPKLVDDDGVALYYFGKNEVVRDSVSSDSGTCLLLLVGSESPLGRLRGFGYYYGYLLRVLAESGGKTKVSRVMDASLPPMNVLHRNVLELGGVSDDGKTALVKFGEANQEANPYKMSFSWQDWDLMTPKVLGIGLDPDIAGRYPVHHLDMQSDPSPGGVQP